MQPRPAWATEAHLQAWFGHGALDLSSARIRMPGLPCHFCDKLLKTSASLTLIISEDRGLEEDFKEKELKLFTFYDGIPNAAAVKNEPDLRRSAFFIHVMNQPSRPWEMSRSVALCLSSPLQAASS